ncbi:tektin-4-like [Aricia agestis]|uniref:tektin-4-like n=1 Tax=Aricia agestis TaxID=91739 RepID=UPI001C207C66|nr:tektin-4-like [Aricia agestis]
MHQRAKLTCPDICPTSNKHEQTQQRKEERKGSYGNPDASPYVPGRIKPPELRVHDPDAPPKYLPQSIDTVSGDILRMGPIGPWAAGHLDWSPHAGTTGVRPVVDKYSITRYSTGEWRKNNAKKLTPTVLDKATLLEKRTKEDTEKTFRGIDDKLDESNKMIDKRVKDLSHWKNEVRKAVDAIANEIEILEQYRVRLKGASRILMIPESISRECLELRTHRHEPDQVRDDAEQELITEVSIVGEIRRIFQNTLNKVETQMMKLKAAKASVEMDWSDKKISLKIDKLNSKLTPDSTLVLYHPGVARWPENATSLEYWKHFCSESIRNCDEARIESKELRNDLMTAIVKGSQDLKKQADRTNAALADTIETTEALCEKLEECLKENLQKIADIENLIDNIKESLREVDRRNKCVMTRLHARNYERPNVENCRDEAQHALMSEVKFIKESNANLLERLRDAEFVRLELIKRRGDLEKDIACKRKSLNIDRDRCGRIRAHIPSPEEFEAAT